MYMHIIIKQKHAATVQCMTLRPVRIGRGDPDLFVIAGRASDNTPVIARNAVTRQSRYARCQLHEIAALRSQ